MESVAVILGVGPKDSPNLDSGVVVSMRTGTFNVRFGFSSRHRSSFAPKAAIATPEGRQVFAPSAFMSVLAGTLLAIELVRRLNGEDLRCNYWTVSPWFPFLSRLRREIEALPGCGVRSVPVIQAVSDELWGSKPIET
jgi:hypothetical protein